MNTLTVFGILAILAVGRAVEIKQCLGSAKKVNNEDVKISKCNEAPCILKKKTTVEVKYIISPDREVKTLTNTVFARLVGLPLPFVGVDNTDACPNVFTLEGEKHGCPLEAGKKYMYKNSFKVLPIYPRVSVEVHWALTSGNKDIFCFEVPAKITN